MAFWVTMPVAERNVKGAAHRIFAFIIFHYIFHTASETESNAVLCFTLIVPPNTQSRVESSSSLFDCAEIWNVQLVGYKFILSNLYFECLTNQIFDRSIRVPCLCHEIIAVLFHEAEFQPFAMLLEFDDFFRTLVGLPKESIVILCLTCTLRSSPRCLSIFIFFCCDA